MKDRISNLVFDIHPDVDANSVDYDERIGYVRVGVGTAEKIVRAYEVIERAGLPVSEVILEVRAPAVNLPL